MSGLARRIADDVKAAMRARDGLRLGTLRMLLADLKNAGIEKKGREGLTAAVDSPAAHLSEEEAVRVLQTARKRRSEAAEQYRQGGRPELAAKEEAEAVLIGEYLPQALDPAELEALVQAAIERTGASSLAGLGMVMKAVMPEVAGRADGKTVSAAVKRLLAG